MIPNTDTRKSSQAKIDANARYNKKVYDRVLIKIRKDAELNSNAVRNHAASTGESLNAFFTRAIAETIEQDRLKSRNDDNEPTE